MSTIASPRDPSAPVRHLPASLVISPTPTPSSSTRASLDTARPVAITSSSSPSSVLSPDNNGPGGSGSLPAPVVVANRANRVALREYYNLRAAAAAAAVAAASPTTPRIDISHPFPSSGAADISEVPLSDVDQPGFRPDEYVARVMAESSLDELLRLYTRTVGEVRALDAEKKALVYDNYSKLIAATETIRKMRSNMDPLNPMASTLNPAIAQIYSQATEMRQALRDSFPAPPPSLNNPESSNPDLNKPEEQYRLEQQQRRNRTRHLAAQILATPPRLRLLVQQGKSAEAARQWERPRRLLQAWKDKGLGGDDVQACIDEGDAALAAVDTATVRIQPRTRLDVIL